VPLDELLNALGDEQVVHDRRDLLPEERSTISLTPSDRWQEMQRPYTARICVELVQLATIGCGSISVVAAAGLARDR
jgi:hypothetical protein